jgi:hypothetical protein
MRALLKKQNTVQPPEWFQAMLTQGVLLLNASLTASADGALDTAQHTAFWRPVAEKVIDEILRAKQTAGPEDRGVVFAWWGLHARELKGVVHRLQLKYPNVKVRHIDHANPAAQGDLFCDGNHFGDINTALKALGASPIDWLPSLGWNAGAAQVVGNGEGNSPPEDTAARMGVFIASTMELHKLYLERLQSVKDEGLEELPAITGIFDSPLLTFGTATAPVAKILAGLDGYVKRALEFGKQKTGTAGAYGMTADEIAALYLYTCESAFYRQINATLRHPDRTHLSPYSAYLRLFFSAVSRLPNQRASLWRGVALDLRAQYPLGRTVTWWGVSSCTSKFAVAKAFLGSRGRRTLFEIAPATAVGIRNFSAFTGEEEFVLAPGTRLKVVDVTGARGGLCTVKLAELAEQRLVA